jgi:hypothetical protein
MHTLLRMYADKPTAAAQRSQLDGTDKDQQQRRRSKHASVQDAAAGEQDVYWESRKEAVQLTRKWRC